jgi:aspartate kinase
MNVITMVFGPDSLPDGGALLHVAQVLTEYRQSGHALIAVIGALPGVTEMLRESIQIANYARVHNKLLSIHTSAARKLIHEPRDRALLIQDIGDILETYNWTGRSLLNRSPTPPEAAAVLAVGDRLNARLLAGHLQNRGVPAVHTADAIVTDDNYLSATPDVEATRRRCQEKLLPLLEQGYIAVVGGSLGMSAQGKLTRLKGDGLYLAGSLLAAHCSAESLWVMTSREGVFTADPNLVADARPVPVLAAKALDDLADHGLPVPPVEAITPAAMAHIPVYIRSVFNPTHPGTYIQPREDTDSLPVIVARKNIRVLTLTGEYLDVEAGLQALGVEHIRALVGYSDASSLHFILRMDQTNIARLALSQVFLETRIESENLRSALITLIGADADSAAYLARRLDVPVHVINLSGRAARRYPALLVEEENLPIIIEKIHNLILPH